jgi:cyclopropane fatty-acyl-phospholipid synthase-like methyltransferase
MNPTFDATEHYGDDFYAAQVADSERSAREYVGYLLTLLQPRSVADLGCGRGAWLKVFAERGVGRVIGYDGPWNSQAKMLDPRIRFQAVDLQRPFTGERVDLAMSLEVAEHLAPETAATFVNSLVAVSDCVMFAAAFSRQGGTNHVNEQPHSYWAKKFADAGYEAFDLFRPRFWANESVCFWYRQNTFIYAARNSSAAASLRSAGVQPVANLAFLDCVHPELFHSMATPTRYEPGLRDIARQFLPAVRRSLSKRFS